MVVEVFLANAFTCIKSIQRRESMIKKGSVIAMLLAGLLMLPQLSQAEPAAGTSKTEPKTGMQFVWVPSGCFNMGSSNGSKDEQPVHRVCFKKGFWMGKYEVTQAQYMRLMDSNPSEFKGDSSRPVENVNWNDSNDAAEELSYIAGGRYRLPSEAEWEYACKAGRDSKYCGPGGKPSRVAWYSDNSGNTTHAVGGKRANGWGLYDMSGNVWEWTQDCYNDSYSGAPANGGAWKSDDCSKRVLRGGSWFYIPFDVRSADRDRVTTGYRGSDLGFRLVQD